MRSRIPIYCVLQSPVLFEEVCMHIPDNAIVIEIAPHGILQAILKRSNKNCTHLALTKRGTPDGVKFILDAIGKYVKYSYFSYRPKGNKTFDGHSSKYFFFSEYSTSIIKVLVSGIGHLFLKLHSYISLWIW